MSEIFFSVIISAYNAEKYIGQAIQSVYKENLSTVEVIVIDDGSEDQTIECVQKLACENIRIITIPHSGVQMARMYGVVNAKGKYLLFLDADDTFVPGALNKIYEAILGHPCDMLIFGTYYYRDNQEAVIQNAEYEEGYLSSRKLCMGMIEHRAIKSLGRKAVKRTIAIQMDRFVKENSVAYGEDILLTFDYASKSEKIYLIQDTLYEYCCRLDGAMHRFYPYKYLDRYTLYKAILYYGEILQINTQTLKKTAQKYLESSLNECKKEIISSNLCEEEKQKFFNAIAKVRK